MKRRLYLTVLAAILMFGLAVACSSEDDDSEPTPAPGTSPTAIASTPSLPPPTNAPTTPGPTATACPMTATSCTLARRLETLLAARDVAGIANLVQAQSFTCPGGTPSGAGGPFPVCTGAPAGESRIGVQIARRYSEGGVMSVQAYQTMLTSILDAVDTTATDANGPGALDLYAVSCADQQQNPANCSRFTAIFSAILRPAQIPPLGTTAGRELLIFYGDPAGVITATWTGIIMTDEAPAIFGTSGGTLFDLGRVFPYK